nr:hypothetical protein [Tanacetum cinerariifolium]
MTLKETKPEESETKFETKVKPTGSMVKSYKKKQLKKFDFVIKEGDHVYLIEEQIKEQKRIKESVKAVVTKREEKVGKEYLVDLLGIDMVTNMYKTKIKEVIEACPKRTRDGWTTIYEKIQTKIENLHKTKQDLGINFNKPLGEYDPLDILNDLARKKRKHADDIYDYFRSTKRYNSSVQYKDHPAGTMLNKSCL